MKGKFFCSKKILVILFLIIESYIVYSEEWVLACQKFTVNTKKNSSTEQISSLLPQLILEQTLNNGIRFISSEEHLDRQLNSLQTERLALFLQLSKESKVKDSLFLTKIKPRELEKAIHLQDKKIQEIQEKIDLNLSEADKLIEDYNNGDLNEKKIFPFIKKTKHDYSTNEDVVLYKNDSSQFFTPSDNAVKNGVNTYIFEKEVNNAKINGLITGEISAFGNYISVTTYLYLYPGSKCISTITEVGNIDDLIGISSRIARKITPAIANTLPVQLKFNIEPEIASENAVITVDGVTVKSTDDFIIDAGIHSLTISAEGFESETITYKFSDDKLFLIDVKLTPLQSGSFNIKLKKINEGFIYFRGIETTEITPEKNSASISVNGKSVLGLFKNPVGENAFVYVSEKNAVVDNNLVINVKPFDRAANIDKRRRSMYTAYSALICSLPLTYYCLGNFNSADKAYKNNVGSYDDAMMWQNRTYGCIGITSACGIWFVVELVRYMFAANQVLPANAKKIK